MSYDNQKIEDNVLRQCKIMNEIQLPTEILIDIFKYLGGKDVGRCRGVCRQWKNAVDAITDIVWQIFCKKEHRNSCAAYCKATLSWQELYKHLSLWSKIDTSTLIVKKLCSKSKPVPCNRFQLLSNNTLAISVCDLYEDDILMDIFADSLAYYDLRTMTEKSKYYLKTMFPYCIENRNLLTYINSEDTLCIIPKPRGKLISHSPIFRVGKLPEYGFEVSKHYILYDTGVYFQNDKNEICVSKLEDGYNGEQINTYKLEKLCKSVITFHYVGNDHVFVLTDDVSSKGNIYSIVDGILTLVARVNTRSVNLIGKLTEFGFDWTNNEILNWLVRKKASNFSTLGISSACRSGNVVVLGTYTCKLKIYFNPQTASGILRLQKADCIIDLREIHKPIKKMEIMQLEVVEIAKGHRIIVLFDMKLYVLDLIHKHSKRGHKIGQ